MAFNDPKRLSEVFQQPPAESPAAAEGDRFVDWNSEE